jgi:hypothetical protein
MSYSLYGNNGPKNDPVVGFYHLCEGYAKKRGGEN